ncbi:MAG TPA: 2-amino-4-hydroxy-6-hydroxymethyldihydropteridine diphosphokinase [Acidimicrobiales bacterium]|nr:2-amino-4-hydroxy-6-hydroxymethyldihydropteridine diphosphokinase [Acidimicrobiales bacterium]
MTAGMQAAPGPRRVLLGLGSNLGDRRRTLREAIESLPGVVAVSGLYETDPVGGPSGQGPYLNLVVAIESDASPRQLLGMCHRIESAAGRVRVERWGPRTLDIDILWIDGETIDEPDLSVPHPRMFQRRFVVVPLHDVAPDLLPPDWEDVDGWVNPVEPL